MLKSGSSLLYKPLLRFQSTSAAETIILGSKQPGIITPPITPSSSTSPSSQANDLPINVKALYFPPQKIPVKHGHLKLDIQLRSYDTNTLEFYTEFIQRIAFYLGVPTTGPKPLPKRHETWTVIKSPFVHAKSKENFERFTYKRLLRCWDTNDEVIELLLSYISKYSVAGVGIKCNLFKNEPITMKSWENDDVTKQINNIQFDNTISNETNEADTLVNSKILELLNSKDFK
ncbi:small ribosomal subunit protein uS10m [Monosporozyma unispora]|nr:mitochondrial 37S ribosomal protein rsm10 [Kazachstania unispora]